MRKLLFIVIFFLGIHFECFAWTPENDPFIGQFRQNPVEIYGKLIQRKKDEGSNFKFPEIAVTFKNILTEIDDILRSSLPHLTNDDRQLLDEIRQKFKNLESLGYPYLDSILEINRFVRVVDYLNFKKTQGPVAAGCGGGVFSTYTEITKLQNHLRKVFPDWKGAEYSPGVTARQVYSRALEKEAYYTVDNAQCGYLNDVSFSKVLALDLGVVFPTYEELDLDFFNRTARVPLFVGGIIPSDSLWADEAVKSKKEFFMHDMNCHNQTFANDLGLMKVYPDDPEPYNFKNISLEEYLKFVSSKHSEPQRFIEFQNDLMKKFPNLGNAVTYILFEHYHEGDLQSDFSLGKLNRVLPNLLEKIKKGYYGPRRGEPGISNSVLAQIPHAMYWLYLLHQELEKTPNLSPRDYNEEIFPALLKKHKTGSGPISQKDLNFIFARFKFQYSS